MCIRDSGYHIGFVEKGEWTKYSININSSGVYRVRVRHASEQSGGQLYLSLNDQNASPILTTNSSGSWFSFINTAIDGVILEEGEHSIKVHFNSDVPVNISSLYFEKTGEISSAPFNSISGKTGSDEKSVELFLNQEISSSTVDGSLDNFEVSINGEIKTINSITLNSSKPKTIFLNLSDNLLYTDVIKVSYSGDLIKSKNSKKAEITFDTPGIYYYWCTPHKGMGMIGLVVVANDVSNIDKIASAKALGKSKKKLKKLLVTQLVLNQVVVFI